MRKTKRRRVRRRERDGTVGAKRGNFRANMTASHLRGENTVNTSREIIAFINLSLPLFLLPSPFLSLSSFSPSSSLPSPSLSPSGLTSVSPLQNVPPILPLHKLPPTTPHATTLLLPPTATMPATPVI